MQKTIFIFLLLIGCLLAKGQDADHLKNLEIYFDKAFEHYYTNNDSTYFYFEKVKTIAKQNDYTAYYIEATTYTIWAASFFYDLEVIKTNLNQLDSILITRKKTIDTLDNKDYYRLTAKYSKGVYQFELKNNQNALLAFNEVIETINNKPKLKDDPDIYNLYLSSNSFVGKIYAEEGKYKLAKQFYEQNLRTLNRTKTKNISFLNSSKILLAEIYRKEKKYKSSNSLILSAIPHYITESKNSNRIIASYESIANNHIELKQIDSAIFYLNKMKDYLPENHPFWYRYYQTSANIHEATNNYPEAEKALQTVLEHTKLKWKNQPHNDIAIAYNNIGLLHAKFDNPKKALNNYALALQQFSKNDSASTINKTVFFKILKNKTKTLNSLNNTTENIKTVNLAIKTLDDLKPSFKNNNDKLFLMDEAFPVFEHGLESAYKLYQKTKHDSLINKAFFYSEKSKSVLLLEAILSTKATKFANIPKEIIEKEQVLKSKINHIEKQLSNSNNNKLKDKLFKLRNTFRELTTNIETNYKSYYNLKYNSEVISVSQLQNLLQKEDVLLSYFYGNHAIYSITITKNTKTIKQYIIDKNLENEIIAIYTMLNSPKSNLKNLNKKTYSLYKKLVAPSLVDIQQKNLIIVADGLLNYIPFSSLNTNQNTHNYLIESHAISYANSVTLLEQLLQKQEPNTEALAFAPNFNNTSSGLLPLPNNITEAKNILTYFKGKTLTGNQATLQNFNTESSRYGILHFATHAILNDVIPEYSYLTFQPENEKENLLYVSDLYNLNLNTNLVTLSACESGIGNLKRGEGFISLARGFYFSGASSICSTLWKVNDASCLTIMDNFYKNLSENETKNNALQKAQLSFLNANKQNALIHPYYWSGFVISGNTTNLPSSNNVLWYLLMVAVFILIGLALKKYRT